MEQKEQKEHKEHKDKERFHNSRFNKIDKTLEFPYNCREWLPEISDDDIKSKLINPNRLIRVIDYNILSDSLLTITTMIKESEIETKLPNLQWKNRKIAIFKELKQLNGDIVCLEEFERDEEFIELLVKEGYDLSFKPRTGEHSEGCALIWKKDKFILRNLIALELNMNRTNKNISIIYDRDNIALFGIFSLKGEENVIIIVCVTHLLFNKNRGDIKLGQTYQIVRSIDLLKKHYQNESTDRRVFSILAGDFNCCPKSGVYKLLVTGSLLCESISKFTLSGQDPDNLQYCPPKKVKSYLLRSLACKYKDKIKEEQKQGIGNNKLIDLQENIQWFNEVCRVCPVLKEENGALKIELEYDNNYRYKDYELKMIIPEKFFSAYSAMCFNICHFIDNPEGNLKKNLPFNLIKDVKELDNIEINCIKMGSAEIKKTIEFSASLTMDIPFSSYTKNTLMSSNFIFFNGDGMKTVRILNLPDVNKILFETGFLPAGDFPSDHLSIGADFILGGEK